MEQLKLYTIRSIPEILNASFALIRENWPQLRKTLLVFIFPTIVVAELLNALLGGDFALESLQQFMGLGSSGVSGGAILSTGSIGLDLVLHLLAFSLYIVGSTLLIATTFAFVRVKEETTTVAIDEGELRKEIMPLFWRVFGTNIGLGLVFFFGIFFLSLLARGIPVLGGIFIIGIILSLPWLIARSALYYPVRFIEEDEFFFSFSRSAELLRGYTWRALGLLALSFLLVGTFVSPSFFLSLIWFTLENLGVVTALAPGSFWSVLFALLGGLLNAVAQFANTIPLICVALLYYSQRERLEGLSLEEEIELIGTDR